MIIGLDDTDSRGGMCTTYLLAVLIEKLERYGIFKDHPFLVRLNPNIKYKTRGNAALAMNFEMNDMSETQKVIDLVINTVEKMAFLSEKNTNPGIVFIENITPDMKHDLSIFSLNAVQDVLEISRAKELLHRHGINHKGFKNERGLVGALAASGFALCGLSDHTFELIAYRQKKNWGSPREIDEGSVWLADAATNPDTWDTVDIENNRIVFAPHSPDPILFGIRGKDEESVTKAFSMIRSEPLERYVVYKTNQNTDMHLIPAKIHEVMDDRSYILDGTVCRSPNIIKGGHVIFGLSENNKNYIECAAFEPTKNFRHIIRELMTGDEVTVFGSVKNGTLNLEKIRINRLTLEEVRNPVCCRKRMKSMGKEQGYRCVKCGAMKKEQVSEDINRKIRPGFYEVPPSARRHLSKPISRFYSRCQDT